MSFISAENIDKQGFNLKWDEACRRVFEELLIHLESHQMEIFHFEYLVLQLHNNRSRYIWQRRVTGNGKLVPILLFTMSMKYIYIYKVETACHFILMFFNDINIYMLELLLTSTTNFFISSFTVSKCWSPHQNFLAILYLEYFTKYDLGVFVTAGNHINSSFRRICITLIFHVKV